ncbi:MAG: hypothetical protein H6718_21220 [Polyangiaceae bacterium]|nr:hypothetical protein [Polyangiaceae bacterium]
MSRWGGLCMAALLLSCAGAQSSARAPEAMEVAEETAAPHPQPTPEGTPTWTRFSELGGNVPATHAELDDLKAQSAYVATVRGRVIWMDLRDAPTRALLPTVRGPVTLTLSDPTPELIAAVNDVAQRYPVEVLCELQWMAELDEPRDLTVLEGLKQVEGLSINLGRGQSELPDFRNFARLKRLTVNAPDSGENLPEIVPRTLEELDAVADFSSEGFYNFVELPHLRRLWVPNNPADFEGLSNSETIEELSVTLQLSQEDVAELRGLKKLRVLQLTTNRDPAAFKALADLPQLKDLSFPVMGFDQEGIAPLNGLTQLEALELLYPRRTETLLAVAKLKKLRKLTLRGAKLSRADLQSLARLPLTELELSTCNFDADSAPVFASFTQLHRLNLIHSLADNRVIAALKKLSELRHLGVPANVDDEAVADLRDLDQLRELDLRGSKISEAKLPVLAALPELRKLWFTATPSRATTAKLVATPQLLFFSEGPSKLNCPGSDWPESCQ